MFVMATMNISLADHMKAFTKAQTRDVRYSNVSDYMHDLIRRDQERRQAIAEIQALVDEELASGPPEPFDLTEFLEEQHARFKKVTCDHSHRDKRHRTTNS
jgi:antitoxin ParD1/3/4